MLGRLTEQIPVNLPRHYTCADIHALILQERTRVGDTAIGRGQSGKGHEFEGGTYAENTMTPTLQLSTCTE